jgi:hypothetical protein
VVAGAAGRSLWMADLCVDLTGLAGLSPLA